jgi:hypothetical protein
MPKKSLSIETFSGGVKNAGSGRDMKNEQSYDMVNMNPNSESGSISMAGTGLTTYQIDNSASTKTDVYAGLQSDTNFTIRSGHGLFRFFSDYSGLKNVSSAHLGSNWQSSGLNNTGGIMDDGSVLLMINNFKDNDNSNATDRPTIPYQYALRALTGRDIIKVCMTVSTVPGTLDGGAWAFDMVNDKWYVSYVHDNGVLLTLLV